MITRLSTRQRRGELPDPVLEAPVAPCPPAEFCPVPEVAAPAGLEEPAPAGAPAGRPEVAESEGALGTDGVALVAGACASRKVEEVTLALPQSAQAGEASEAAIRPTRTALVCIGGSGSDGLSDRV